MDVRLHFKNLINQGVLWLKEYRELQICLLTGICLLVATTTFSYYVNEKVHRFSRHEIEQSSSSKKSQALPLPVVLLQIHTLRNSKNPPVEMRFQALLDNENLPKWSLIEFHETTEHYILANTIDNAAIGPNFTLEEAKSAVFIKKLHV